MKGDRSYTQNMPGSTAFCRLAKLEKSGRSIGRNLSVKVYWLVRSTRPSSTTVVGMTLMKYWKPRAAVGG